MLRDPHTMVKCVPDPTHSAPLNTLGLQGSTSQIFSVLENFVMVAQNINKVLILDAFAKVMSGLIMGPAAPKPFDSSTNLIK